MPTDKLIVALDHDRAVQSLSLVKTLQNKIRFFKIGSQLFTREGPAIVRNTIAQGADVFLDLKFHDIPQTVANAVASAAALGARFATLHACGGREMLQAAARAAEGTQLQLLAVTVLTSSNEETLREIGCTRSVQEQALALARLAVESGIPGLVCSPLELDLLRKELPKETILVTPGIRGPGDASQDQKRTLAADEALRRGASHLVIGRPITHATDPVAAAQKILHACAGLV